MSIKDQLIYIQGILQALLVQASAQAQVIICPDLVHLWRTLLDGTQNVKALVLCAGERVRGELGIAAPLARVDRDFIVVLSRGRSTGLNAGDALVDTVGNSPPMFDIVSYVRDYIRAMQFDPTTCEQPVDYHGFSLFNTEGSGRVVDAYQFNFSVGTQLLVVTPPGNDSPGQGPTT